MLEAARLLRFTDLTVGEVAHRVGFDDQLYFSRAFKRHARRAAAGVPARARDAEVHASARSCHGARRPRGATLVVMSHGHHRPPPADAPALPADLRLGAVHLTVTRPRPLRRLVPALARPARRTTRRRRAELGDGREDVLVLHEPTPAPRPPAATPGLYHYALLYPTREELARAALRLAATRTPIQGASDHGTHEAIYLPDPDGNGIELAADRPREQWPSSEERVTAAARSRSTSPPCWPPSRASRPAPRPRRACGRATCTCTSATSSEGLAFYRDVVGFERMRDMPTAAFVSRRRLPPPPGLQRLARPRRGPQPPAHRRPAPLDVVLPPADGRRRGARPRRAAGVARRGPPRRLRRPRPVEDRAAGRTQEASVHGLHAQQGDRHAGRSRPRGRSTPASPSATSTCAPPTSTGSATSTSASWASTSMTEARDVPGWGTTGDILFLAAGGYHHHLGFNTWKSAGGPPQPDGVAGLHHVASATRRARRSPTPCAACARSTGRSARPPTTAPTRRSTSPTRTATTSSSRWDRPFDEWPRDAAGPLHGRHGDLDLERCWPRPEVGCRGRSPHQRHPEKRLVR